MQIQEAGVQVGVMDFFCDSIDVNVVDKNVIARILLQIIVEQYMSILLAIKMAAQNLASVRGWQVARI